MIIGVIIVAIAIYYYHAVDGRSAYQMINGEN